MKKKIVKKDKRGFKPLVIFIIIIVLFLLFNISIISFMGHPDIILYYDWGNQLFEKGFNSFYTINNAVPPLLSYILKFNSGLNQILFREKFSINHYFIIISKLIPLLCNLIIGVILFFYIKDKDYKKAIFVSILYLFNLVVIYNSSYWGQMDAVNSLFLFLCVLFLIEEKYEISTIFLSIAVLIKFQSLFLVPIIWFALIMRLNYKKVLKIIFLNLFVLFLLLIPFIIDGAFFKAFNFYFHVIDYDKLVTVNSFNLWFLVSPKSPDWSSTLSDQTIFLGLSLKSIGLILFGLYCIMVIYQLYKNKSKESLVLASASIALAFFILPTQIRERYMFYMFPLFALLLLSIKKYWKFSIIYIILMITHLFNIMMVDPFYGNNIVYKPIQLLINLLISEWSFKSLAILIAIINVSVFIYFSKIGIFNNLFGNIKNDIKSIYKKKSLKNKKSRR